MNKNLSEFINGWTTPTCIKTGIFDTRLVCFIEFFAYTRMGGNFCLSNDYKTNTGIRIVPFRNFDGELLIYADFPSFTKNAASFERMIRNRINDLLDRTFDEFEEDGIIKFTLDDLDNDSIYHNNRICRASKCLWSIHKLFTDSPLLDTYDSEFYILDSEKEFMITEEEITAFKKCIKNKTTIGSPYNPLVSEMRRNKKNEIDVLIDNYCNKMDALNTHRSNSNNDNEIKAIHDEEISCYVKALNAVIEIADPLIEIAG